MKVNLQLVGNTVTLVPYERAHVETYARWLEDPWIQKMTASEPCTLEEEIAAQNYWTEDPNKLTFIILDGAHENPKTGGIEAMAGDVNLIVNSEDKTQAEILVMIGEASCRRRGLAKAALDLMIWYARSRLGVKRIFCKISEDNLASLELFEKKCGFKRCGYAACFKEIELELTTNQVAFDRPAEFVRARPIPVVASTSSQTVEMGGAAANTRPSSPGSSRSAVGLTSEVGRSKPLVRLKTFTGVVGDGIGPDVRFAGQIMLLDGCAVISVVDSDAAPPAMGALSAAMSSRFDVMPIASTLLGEADEIAKVIAKHLAKRASLQCFVSCSLPDSASAFIIEIAQHVHCALDSLLIEEAR